MIYSMTAFARAEKVTASQQLTCEIRSINHRYAEVSVHLPESLRIFEMAVRDRIRKVLKRGKIDCNIRLQQAGEAANEVNVTLNQGMLAALHRASETVISILPAAIPMSVTDVLRFPGVMEVAALDAEALESVLLDLVDHTLQTLLRHRAQEGAHLLPLFEEKLQQISSHLQEVRAILPVILQAAREKLLNRFQEASVQLNSERLEQEMVLFAQKTDVLEEIERAESHVKAIQLQLKEGGLVGRQLDFLLQELNREANTLGSKSVHHVTTQASLQMKVLIEQIREQVQNIE